MKPILIAFYYRKQTLIFAVAREHENRRDFTARSVKFANENSFLGNANDVNSTSVFVLRGFFRFAFILPAQNNSNPVNGYCCLRSFRFRCAARSAVRASGRSTAIHPAKETGTRKVTGKRAKKD